jgi:hypothetical protein
VSIKKFAIALVLALASPRCFPVEPTKASAQVGYWYETTYCSWQRYCGYWGPAPQNCLYPTTRRFCQVYRVFSNGAEVPVRWYWI